MIFEDIQTIFISYLCSEHILCEWMESGDQRWTHVALVMIVAMAWNITVMPPQTWLKGTFTGKTHIVI